MKSFSPYISFFGSSSPSTCWSIQTLTWILVPSDTLSGFLWIVVAKVVLFKGLLYINAAKKVATVYLMQWWQLSLKYFSRFPSFSYVPETCLYHWSFLEDYVNGWSTSCELYSSYPTRSSSSDNLSLVLHFWDFNWERLTTTYFSSNLSMSSDKSQSPIYYFGPLSLQV